MKIQVQEVVAQTVEGFPGKYKHFKDFCQNEKYEKYWELCVIAISDKELLSHIVFCNDLFSIPPVKTFLLYYKEDLVQITGDDMAILDPYIKKSIGAFWGMVFKFVLGYTDQKNVTVSLNTYFKVSTATFFKEPREKIELA